MEESKEIGVRNKEGDGRLFHFDFGEEENTTRRGVSLGRGASRTTRGLFLPKRAREGDCKESLRARNWRRPPSGGDS